MLSRRGLPGGAGPQGASGLLIADSDLSDDASRRLQEAIREGYEVRAIK